jgi:membrane protease YdiL (CAAX protease family)
MTAELPSHTLDTHGMADAWRKRQVIELSVFLLLIVPSMALSFFAVKQGSLGFVLVAIATIFRDLGLVSLILYFVWRNGEALAALGWTLRNVKKDALLGFVLFFPFTWATGVLEKAFQAIGFSVPSTPTPSFLDARGIGQLVLGSVLVVIVALTEETIFRGYLILRLKAVRRSSFLAVVLSAAIFSLGHGYEGTAGVMTVGVMGAIFAIIYLWRKSLVAPIVMHFLQDFIGVVLIPVLAAK